MKKKIILKIIIFIIIFFSLFDGELYAHSGKTDSNGGHRDNKNKSGLGSYHYHCGGYPAHLHPNGVCPYKSQTTSSNVKSSDSNSGTTSTISSNKKEGKTGSSMVISTPTNNNTKTNNENNSSGTGAGIAILGLLGGGGYLAYKGGKKK